MFFICFYLWFSLLVFSPDWGSFTYPGKMFRYFSALSFLNDIWHLTSGFYVCYINGSEPESICYFHQTICQPLKLGHTVLFTCDVIALSRVLEIKYPKYSWGRTFLSNTKGKQKLVVALAAEMKWYLILKVSPKAWFSSTQWLEYQHSSLAHITCDLLDNRAPCC